MLWAAFFGFLGSGEIVHPSESQLDSGWHLGVQNVHPNSHSAPSQIEVVLKGSKTDPFRQGHTLHIMVTGRQICPVDLPGGNGCKPRPPYLSGGGGGGGGE